MSAEVLHVHVGESLADSLVRATRVMDSLERGECVEPYHAIGFAEIGAMLGVLSPRRWDLIALLRAQGTMSVAELARRAGRNYKNVHQDVAALMEWQILDRDEQGRVRAPYDELVLDIRMPGAKAA